MKIPFIESKILKDYVGIISKMYDLGWDERNAGNVSYIIDEKELINYVDINNVKRTFPISIDASYLNGKYLLITGSGKYFRNVKSNPEDACALVRINNGGKEAQLIWGLINGGVLTSEVNAHISSHISRSKVDEKHRVIIHTHATYINIMSSIYPLDEKKLSLQLWKMNTENIIIFPEGVGIIPWEIPGNSLIGNNTAEKFKNFKIVLWPLHGVVASGSTLDDTFGLIETVEKAAHMYLWINNNPSVKLIENEDLIKLAKAFSVKPNPDFI